MIIGSVNYIAPEQVTGSPTDARTDVYSAGIMLFEMLTGRQPFNGETPLAVAYAHVNSDVPAVSTVVGGIPPSVDQLVRAATSRDPNLRPANAAVFMRVARALRGMPEPAEAVTGAWAVPAAAATTRTAAEPVRRRTARTPTPRSAGSARAGVAARRRLWRRLAHDGRGRCATATTRRYAGGAPHRGGGEPFLQRWLFSRRLVYVLAAVLVLVGLVRRRLVPDLRAVHVSARREQADGVPGRRAALREAASRCGPGRP